MRVHEIYAHTYGDVYHFDMEKTSDVEAFKDFICNHGDRDITSLSIRSSMTVKEYMERFHGRG